MNPIHVPAGEGNKLNIFGNIDNIRIHSRDTGGVLSVVESEEQPGSGPPPHVHSREDETFHVLEGEYEINVGGKTICAQKGATIFAPRGIPHVFRCTSQRPGRLMVVITPGGFEEFFEEVGAMSPEQQQQNIPRCMELAKKYGAEILPPPGK
jgi:quercetin dioxygenase-like cupin family protein